jgi:hypothetical protein
MKTRRTIYYILAVCFILFNIPAWVKGTTIERPDDAAELAGYYIGSCIFFIIGLVFLLLAFSVNKKIRRKKEQELMDSLPG